MNASLRSFIISAGLFLIVTVLFIVATESPLSLHKPVRKKNHLAAIAIRDNVIPFQKFGTRLFTTSYLEKYYDTVFYFTEFSPGEKDSAFKAAVQFSTDHYNHTDIFLLAHTNFYHILLANLPKENAARIRLVYNTGCNGAGLGKFWTETGTTTYIGHIGTSYSPVFYFYFLRRWCNGSTIQEAVDESNRITAEKLMMYSLFLPDNTGLRKLIKETYALKTGCGNYKISD
jgi:hypothetical protein